MSEGLGTQLVIDPMERIFDSMGMMEGSLAPMKRAAVGVALGYAIAYGTHPAVAFDEKTFKPRPWLVTNPEAPDGTWVPAWLIVITPALIFSVAI